jgi:predicted nucleic acid-binding protein
LAEPDASESAKPILRICLDVNIWVAHVLAIQNGRQRSSASALAQIMRDRECEAGPVQLVISWEMLATLENVLHRLHFDPKDIADVIAALIGLMKAGPEQFDPHLLPEGGKTLPMKDTEDAGMLASLIAVRADLLITNNLADFAIKGCERIDTQKVELPGQPPRQLFALIYERNDGVRIVIAHPIDAVGWLRKGLRPTPDAIRATPPR